MPLAGDIGALDALCICGPTDCDSAQGQLFEAFSFTRRMKSATVAIPQPFLATAEDLSEAPLERCGGHCCTRGLFADWGIRVSTY